MSPPGGPVAANPPASDQPHDRHAYQRWLTKASTGAHVQFDTAAVLPFYLWLAASGALLENHCSGFGTNSTPNHLLIVGGQSPTLRNPPRAVSTTPSHHTACRDHSTIRRRTLSP